MLRRRWKPLGYIGIGAVATGVLVLAVAACGPATGEVTKGSPQQISLIATDFTFAPNTLRLTDGRPIELTYRNDGKLEHDFTIVGAAGDEQPHTTSSQSAHSHDAVPGSIHAAARTGEQVVVTFALKAGTYDLVCTMPGHREAGMAGKIQVG